MGGDGHEADGTCGENMLMLETWGSCEGGGDAPLSTPRSDTTT